MVMAPSTVLPVAVPVPDDLARELRALARRRDADDKRAQAAVLRARELGCSQREIGKLLGMSHVGIAKMERRARETNRLPEEE
jgi:DNA-directed RNA polymerase specialized sigma24 family protein